MMVYYNSPVIKIPSSIYGQKCGRVTKV
jgi:hypothetical protein